MRRRRSLIEIWTTFIDPLYSETSTSRYWERIGRSNIVPDTTAPGFGEYNAAGYREISTSAPT
jgi:hypothetical protein